MFLVSFADKRSIRVELSAEINFRVLIAAARRLVLLDLMRIA